MRRIKWRVKAMLEYLNFHSGILAASITARRRTVISPPPLCFIAGCGRSGTTMLGRLLSLHPEVSYLNEPRHFWIAVSHRTDIWGYTKTGRQPVGSQLITSVEKGEAELLNALFNSRLDAQHKMVIEKTPENVFRLPWLHALAPDAKLIHIVRNGPDVVRSILVEAAFDIPYGLRDMNNWYGQRDRKRGLLAETAKKMGVSDADIATCVTDSDWAALEWICSLRAYRDGYHHFAVSGFHHLRYEDLLADPLGTFSELIRFLGLPPAPELEKKILEFVQYNQRQPSKMVLPFGIRELFETEQANYGYIDSQTIKRGKSE